MGKVFTREFSFLGGAKVHTFWGKIFPPRWVIERVGFSLAVGVFSFPDEVLLFSWERVISRGRGRGPGSALSLLDVGHHSYRFNLWGGLC